MKATLTFDLPDDGQGWIDRIYRVMWRSLDAMAADEKTWGTPRTYRVPDKDTENVIATLRIERTPNPL